MTTNNNNKIAETTTTLIDQFTDKKWDLVLNTDSAYSDVNYRLVESAIDLIIANTTSHRNVGKLELNTMVERLKEMFNKDGCLNIRSEGGDIIYSMNFSNFIKNYGVSKLTRNLIDLLSHISNFDIWFNDSYSNEYGVGFCCKNKNGLFITIVMETEEYEQ